MNMAENPFKDWNEDRAAEFNRKTEAGRHTRIRFAEPGSGSTSEDSSAAATAGRGKGRTGTGAAKRLVTEEDVASCILQEIERRGWLCFRSAPCYRTGRKVGEPDLEVWASGGRTFHIELKRPVGGKVSTDQLGVIAWGRKLGHTVHVITSLAEFKAAVDGQKK